MEKNLNAIKITPDIMFYKKNSSPTLLILRFMTSVLFSLRKVRQQKRIGFYLKYKLKYQQVNVKNYPTEPSTCNTFTQTLNPLYSSLIVRETV